MANQSSATPREWIKCLECETPQEPHPFCVSCGQALLHPPMHVPAPTEPASSQAFAGAKVAAGYVETEHTELAADVRAKVRAATAESMKEEVPAVVDHVPTMTEPETLESPLVELGQLGTTSTTARPATKGVRGLLTAIGIRMKPGTAELVGREAAAAAAKDEETVRQATWTRAVSVLVANRKGGVGKTPVAILLGGTLASIRGGSVAIIEVADDPGALAFRAEGNPALGLGELVRDAHGIRAAGQLAGYTAPQTSFAAVIGSSSRREQLAGADVATVSQLVDDYYSIRVMDSGNQHSSSAFLQAVSSADALVIPTLNAGDSVLEAVALVDALRSAGGHSAELADRAILLRLTDGRPEHPQVLERINRVIENARFANVLEIPYDAHIAERGQLTLASLAPTTRQAFAAAAASVVRSLHDHIR